MSTYLCGIDIGGTFTDCVVVDEAGRVTTGKAPSTPGDFGEGMIAALDIVAGKLGMQLDALNHELAVLAHGTTVGTNAIIQKKGAKVRPDHHEGPQRRHPHHARLARAHRPRHPPRRPHPGEQQA